jgi:hypothetical protein
MELNTEILKKYFFVMELNEEKIIAVCGLICSDCKIYNAQKNPEIAKELVEYFKGKWENVITEDFHCNGCIDKGDCWSEECWIRDCCVDKYKLDYCYECEEFPCKKLKERAGEDEGYENALNNLKEMKKKI